MNANEAAVCFSKLPKERQILMLAAYAHDLTIVARGTYIPGTEDISEPRRLRMLNEVQHRVSGQLRNLLEDDQARYPAEVFAHIAIADDDDELLKAFVRRLGMTMVGDSLVPIKKSGSQTEPLPGAPEV